MNSIILKSSNKKDAWRKVKALYGKEFTEDKSIKVLNGCTAFSTGKADCDGYIVDDGNAFYISFPGGDTIAIEYESPKQHTAELERENAKLREENIILRQKILKFGKVSRELKELLTATAEFSAFLEIIEKDAKQFEKEGEV